MRSRSLATEPCPQSFLPLKGWQSLFRSICFYGYFGFTLIYFLCLPFLAKAHAQCTAVFVYFWLPLYSILPYPWCPFFKVSRWFSLILSLGLLIFFLLVRQLLGGLILMAVRPWTWPARPCGVVCSMHHDSQWLYSPTVYAAFTLCIHCLHTVGSLGGREQGGSSVHT